LILLNSIIQHKFHKEGFILFWKIEWKIIFQNIGINMVLGQKIESCWIIEKNGYLFSSNRNNVSYSIFLFMLALIFNESIIKKNIQISTCWNLKLKHKCKLTIITNFIHFVFLVINQSPNIVKVFLTSHLDDLKIFVNVNDH
jgi:hypothetical protein